MLCPIFHRSGDSHVIKNDTIDNKGEDKKKRLVYIFMT